MRRLISVRDVSARGAAWFGLLTLTTSLLVPLRSRLNEAHVALVLLVIVLLAAADGGRRVGLGIAAAAFLYFNWFFLPPYGSLVVSDPLDWIVLLVFTIASGVASQLLHRAQREARDAQARAGELGELASLGEEAMHAPRADAALVAVTESVRRTMRVTTCRVHVTREARDPSGENAFETIASVGGSPEAEIVDQLRAVVDRDVGLALLEGEVLRVLPNGPRNLTSALGAHAPMRLIFPLRARAAVIGALELSDRRGIPLNLSRERLLSALTYYAALGADRLRLERAAAHVEALRESDRLKNAVLASVSHDLRTPLTTIKALAHDLGALGDERAEIIEQEADRLNRFVSEILDVSRLSSGAFPVALDIVPVDDLISAAIQQVEGAFGGRAVEVRISPEHPLLIGRFDLTHSVRILVNLLENARKYAPEESPLEVDVTRKGAWLEIAVADRGPGVPPHETDRIFEALYRPSGSRPDVGSAGLGLAISRGIAEAQGGTLEYAPRPGGGSLFTLRLPAVDLTELGAPLPLP